MDDDDIYIPVSQPTATGNDIYIPATQPTAPAIVPIPVSMPLAPAALAPVGIPVPPAAAAPPARKIVLDNQQLSQLYQQGYTEGLAQALAKSCSSFSLRIWIVDNSGSMNKNDGNRLISTSSSSEVKSVACTRWKEIQETVTYHAQMSALLGAPTTFRLLNDPGGGLQQEFTIAGPDDLQTAMHTINNASPSGVTPLSEHVRTIRNEVEAMAPSLRAEGRKVAIILATDGLPSDPQGISSQVELDEFQASLRSLEGLPVWIVVRLCTDEKKIVNFYNDLDNQLEISVEVLDNFIAEGKEMYDANPWINYSLPIHRMREFGFQNRIFDFLDERALTLSELRDFCFLLFGERNFDGVPEPEVDFNGFLRALNILLKKEKEQWHPYKQKVKPLISLKQLSTKYGDGSCTIM